MHPWIMIQAQTPPKNNLIVFLKIIYNSAPMMVIRTNPFAFAVWEKIRSFFLPFRVLWVQPVPRVRFPYYCLFFNEWKRIVQFYAELEGKHAGRKNQANHRNFWSIHSDSLLIILIDKTIILHNCQVLGIIIFSVECNKKSVCNNIASYCMHAILLQKCEVIN